MTFDRDCSFSSWMLRSHSIHYVYIMLPFTEKEAPAFQASKTISAKPKDSPSSVCESLTKVSQESNQDAEGMSYFLLEGSIDNRH